VVVLHMCEHDGIFLLQTEMFIMEAMLYVLYVRDVACGVRHA
jgi:hypothetical protein